jgi:hypothetical protein
MPSLDEIAESYVRLVLSVGQHDPDYVDAYYGPDSLKPQPTSLREIVAGAESAMAALKEAEGDSSDPMALLRVDYLRRQLASLVSRAGMLQGRKLTFDEESDALYDAVAPTLPESHFRLTLEQLSDLLPGSGPVSERYDRFKSVFVIAKEKLAPLFDEALREARSRTRKHLSLPANEGIELQYVTDKAWSGYNWYKGKSRSLIQINTDLPIYIDRAIDLGCHEGYPGHHVYNALLEEHLVRQRHWVEFSVYALFSPQSLIAEGTANFGIEVAFPGAERVAYERDVLFPLAGLPASEAEHYYRVHELFLKLAYAGNEAARGYLDGRFNREEAAGWLVEYALMSPERALQRTRFFDKYRSYVINYNLGQDLVRRYIEIRIGPDADPKKRWEEFARLISSPRLPSGLQ